VRVHVHVRFVVVVCHSQLSGAVAYHNRPAGTIRSICREIPVPECAAGHGAAIAVQALDNTTAGAHAHDVGYLAGLDGGMTVPAFAQEESPLERALVLGVVVNLGLRVDISGLRFVCMLRYRLRAGVRFEERHGGAHAGGVRTIPVLRSCEF
jgi:hypothetical protein